jgi:hypothetical protein
MTTTTLTKKDLNRIPQMFKNMPENAFITIEIVPSIESTKEYQEAERFANECKKSPGRYETVLQSMENPPFDLTQFITIPNIRTA